MATILLVEDDDAIRWGLQLALETGEHRILRAASANEALALLSGERPDLVLLDLMLPGITGQGLCRRIRSRPDLREVPIIVITALAGQPEMGGCDPVALLHKPFELSALVELVARYVHQQSQ